MSVIYRGTFYSDRWLFMSWQMCNWRLVETSPCIDIDCINDIVSRSAPFPSRRVCHLILPRRSEQEAAVRSECEPSEERGKGFVCIDVCVLDAKSTVGIWGVLHGSHSRQGHCRWCWGC
jgi:hypothetical protein